MSNSQQAARVAIETRTFLNLLHAFFLNVFLYVLLFCSTMWNKEKELAQHITSSFWDPYEKTSSSVSNFCLKQKFYCAHLSPRAHFFPKQKSAHIHPFHLSYTLVVFGVDCVLLICDSFNPACHCSRLFSSVGARLFSTSSITISREISLPSKLFNFLFVFWINSPPFPAAVHTFFSPSHFPPAALDSGSLWVTV